MDEYQSEKAAELLLKWYDLNKRELPWRQDKDPYRIWISEIMLQQTRVEAVIEYYKRFIKELPDLKALAEISDERLLKLWEGLGYYSRARNLKKAAIEIVENYAGKLPASYKDLLTLSGIGPYTAGAIASIAFDIRRPAVDGNVLRVMSRVLGSDRDISKQATVNDIYDCLSVAMPANRPGDFNQALMELGAVVCLPNGGPRCDNCPIARLCQAFIEGNPEKYPVKSPKKPRKIEEKTVFIIEYDGRYLLHKRPDIGLLAAMWEFPNVPGTLSAKRLPDALQKYGLHIWTLVGQKFAKHLFTHVEWHMTGFFVRTQNISHCTEDYRWMSLDEIEQSAAVPSAFCPFMENIWTMCK
ncbi:MAG: A/G-specific adenine glycosylase [Eubacteriales bacterium]|nr:A/G-specific adenine glycosylase [Eubacteriales bacterium]